MASRPHRWTQAPGQGPGGRLVRVRKADRRAVPPATNDNRMPMSLRLMRLAPLALLGVVAVLIVWAIAA